VISGLCSIIIPSYNHEKYVGSAIQSALDQTYGDIEVIVVDDGSGDSSLERIRAIGDRRLTLHVQENRGAHAAINTGLAMARGEYLAILNSDDMYDRERIRKSLDRLTPHGDAGFLSTWIHIIDGDGRVRGTKKAWHNLDPWSIEHPEKSFRKTGDPALNLLMWNYVATTSNFVMHRSVYEAVGVLRNLRFVHDWDYALRVSHCSQPVVLEEPLLSYRIHDRNTISSDRKWMLFEICWIMATHLPSYEGKRLFADPDREVLLKDLEMLYESINLQGNDKLFWVMRSCFESLRKEGVANPEELLLADPGLRDGLIGMVRDQDPALLSALRKGPAGKCWRSFRNIFTHG
jgi:glycosyltransferase involved in cell wall biosynthesis